jgi:L-lactate dehydrogenase
MKIGIIGCGQVGAAIAYACVLRGVGTEIVLIDRNPELAVAQAEDIFHATPFSSPITVSAGNFDDLAGAGIVMIAAGAAQKDGETRLDLLKRNADIFREMVPRILSVVPEAILLIASNPVDVMTHMVSTIASQTHCISPNRVIGSGTMLDTARFRTLLAQYLKISSHSIHAHVLGEHGDSEVLHWSGATIGNLHLDSFSRQVGTPVTEEMRAQIDDGVRRAAYRIIKGKGATWFGIGAGMARLAQAIIRDEGAVMTCSSLIKDITPDIASISLSFPRIINRHGIIKTLNPELNKNEQRDIFRSAEVLFEATSKIGF